jgi:hypothetical protein
MERKGSEEEKKNKGGKSNNIIINRMKNQLNIYKRTKEIYR